MPPTSSSRAARGRVPLRPGRKWTVVGAVFSRVNITMARPKLKISRKFSCFISGA
jgi:bifunctional pyridoxal-dependent enzyme with beta-cystathionase and maltose regulon repressor activities